MDLGEEDIAAPNVNCPSRKDQSSQACLMTEAHLTQPLVVKSKALSSGVCWPHASQGDSRVGNACAHGIYHDTSSSDEDELEGSINAVRDITDPAVTLGPHNFPTNFEADIIVMLKGRGTRQ